MGVILNMKIINISIILLLALNNDALLPMKRGRDDEQLDNISKRVKKISVTLEKCLKQGEAREFGKNHSLHCGYYALWNALCCIDPTLTNQRMERKAFHENLDQWEAWIRAARLKKTIDNLEPNELDYLIKKINPSLRNQITIVCSKNQLQGFSQGHALSESLLRRIARFRNENQPQAFIINTSCAFDAAQKGTGHFITIIVSEKDDSMCYEIYNSSKHLSNQEYQDSFFKPLNRLVEQENLDVLKARARICLLVEQVRKYLEASQQDIQSWVYVRTLEEYVQALSTKVFEYKGVLKDETTEAITVQIRNTIRRLRQKHGMNNDFYECQGVIHNDYAHNVLQVINNLWQQIDDLETRGVIKDILWGQDYAYEPEHLRGLVVKNIAQRYQEIQTNAPSITPETFGKIAQEFGIAQDIIEEVSQVLGSHV